MLEYYDRDFAQGRLTNTIISVHDRAALVLEVGPNQRLTVEDLESGVVTQIPITDESVSHIRPKVGWINVPRQHALFAAVMPERRWKQGIPLNNLPQVEKKYLGMALNNNYPSYARCIDSQLRKAFSRYWAVGNGRLWYKGLTVATVDGGVVTFKQDKLFLRESFEECIR